jgi:hypothetical protein
MVLRPVRVLLASALVLTGCSALIGVNDIFLDPNAVPGNEGGFEGSTGDGPITGDGGGDGGDCKADLQTDKKNCGRCGHDCLGGVCNAGTCEAFELASITDAPLYDVVTAKDYVFTTTRISLATQTGGLWRIPKAGGAAELYVAQRYAEAVAVLDDTVYFVVDEAPAVDPAPFGGGLYKCPVLGPSPCTPTRIAVATTPGGLTIDKPRVLYGDSVGGNGGLMAYTPPGPPTVFRPGYGFSTHYFADGPAAFYTATITNNTPYRAKVLELLPDASVDETYVYVNTYASNGSLFGNASFLLFAAYDYKVTSGGVVRRIPRAGSGGVPCDYGGTGNKRPYGVFADATRVYWTNQGDGPDSPYTGGSLATCDVAGCCTTPTTLWTGDGEPTGVTADADAIYFVTSAKGSVWKVAKP